jgi:GT2 family glycosyltransferase
MADLDGLTEVSACLRPSCQRLAALLTCHNRREQTLHCLASLAAAKAVVSSHVDVDTFLVDDGCSDGTTAAVRAQFPDVRVIAGTGNLFWCGGMGLAWTHAAAHDYDGYLWLNDDVTLDQDAIERLVAASRRLSRDDGAVIVVGATRAEEAGAVDTATYGGLDSQGVLPASAEVRRIELFNGNIVLVSRRAFQVLGGLSKAYTHGLADIDYGVRAKKAGVPVWLAAGSLGSCSANKTARWQRADLPVWTRLRELHRPTGCPPWQLARLVWSNGGWWFPWSVAKLYCEALFPGWSAPKND